jgi:hypothetical protein
MVDPEPLEPATTGAQLERLGITVITMSDAEDEALVASIPLGDKVDTVARYLHEHGIHIWGSSGRGQCGIYVPVRDFFKAQKLLLQIKPDLLNGLDSEQSTRICIWEPQHP